MLSTEQLLFTFLMFLQVQSVGPHGDSQPSRAVHFRTLERSDHYPAGVLDHRK